MGIDYDGGMIVGQLGCKIECPEEFDDLNEMAEAHDMDTMSTYYDAPEEASYFGFCVPNIDADRMYGNWNDDVQRKATKFKAITGIKAMLVGTQSIW